MSHTTKPLREDQDETKRVEKSWQVNHMELGNHTVITKG